MDAQRQPTPVTQAPGHLSDCSSKAAVASEWNVSMATPAIRPLLTVILTRITEPVLAQIVLHPAEATPHRQRLRSFLQTCRTTQTELYISTSASMKTPATAHFPLMAPSMFP